MDPTASIRDRTVQRRLRSRAALTSRLVRRIVLVLALILAGCGGSEPRTNHLRPAPPVTLTGAIHADAIQISPNVVGAGQITLIVSNQSGRAQRVTFETDPVNKTSGRRASSPLIPKGATGRLTIDAREGSYAVHVADDSIRAAHVRVGAPRKSGQNQLLLP
jgi:hypothetical protein